MEGVIGQALQYPSKSLRNEEEGIVKVRVRIDRAGNILEVVLIEKSGYTELDKEARGVFARIGKFPPVPDNVSPEYTEFLVELPINFTLSGG